MSKARNPFFIETIGIINNKYEVKYNLPARYYFESIKNIDAKILPPEDLEKISFFIPPLCNELLMDTDSIEFSAYALSHLDGARQSFDYYIDLAHYYKEKAEKAGRKVQIETGDKERPAPDRAVEILLPKDKMSMSADALARMDGYRHECQYYVDLENYYKAMEEYEERNLKTEHDFFIIPEKESFSLSPEAIARLDGFQHETQHYINLSSYYEKTHEYDRKKALYDAGDKDIFKRPDSMIASGRETSFLSAEALARLDGFQYEIQHYNNLSDYYKDVEEYERKMELYNAGYTDIFESQEHALTSGRETFELSPDALAYADGFQHEGEYYKTLSTYYKEMEDYNNRMELFNGGNKNAFKEEQSPAVPEQDKVRLSADALARIDGYKYEYQYYIKMENYYKELDEYNEKAELLKNGLKDISDEQGIDIRDKIEIGKNNERIWTPSIEEVLAFSRGKVSPYFLDTLLYTLKQVDGNFENNLQNPGMRLKMDCGINVMDEKELEELIKEIQSRKLQ